VKSVKSKKAERPPVDLTAQRRARLADLFPEAVSEGRIDLEKLRAALGEAIEGQPERYTFTWAGKRDAVRLLQVPTRASLRPCPEDSINWESANHIFVEGDNLEVLKLLYKPYAGQVKMIYIDPPYNTGNDFVYLDDFSDPVDQYLRTIGERDDKGNQLTNKPDRRGHIHSTWLSMMYPRLFLARQLLREEGVLFVSIDDNEMHNLRLLLNEVFGEENFLAVFVRRRRMSTGMRGEPVSPDHEYIVAYARNLDRVVLYGNPRKAEHYPHSDSRGQYASTDLTVGMTREMRPNQWYEITNPRTGKGYWPDGGRVWRFKPDTMRQHIEDGNIIWPEDEPSRRMKRPRFKTRFDPILVDTTTPVSTWINHRADETEEANEARVWLHAGLNQDGTKELRELFGEQVLEYPKPVSLLEALIHMATRDDDLILDFFAGSCTTAHAAMVLNRKDGGRRRTLMVQLPEPTPPDSTARRLQLISIAEIGKERIRRILRKLSEERKDQGRLFGERTVREDLGVRVFKLAESNFRQWSGVEDRNGEAYVAEMDLFTDPLLPAWRPEDVAWELALNEGYSLSSLLGEEKVPGGNWVLRVTDPESGRSLRICLDDRIDPGLLDALKLGKEDYFLCRDAALTDELAANLALSCKLKTI
jgi:adenine-specific DNA-methyltransferase